MEATTYHGKQCWFTTDLKSASEDIKTLTSEDVRKVPYIYVDTDMCYYVTDKGRFFAIKYSKTFQQYIISELAWQIKKRNARYKNPYVQPLVKQNKRACLDIVKCVYCAFISKRWINDKIFFKYKDGNNQHPYLSNIIDPISKKKEYLVSFSADSWRQNYSRFLNWIKFNVDIAYEDAEDCVQTAFIEAFINTNPYTGFLNSQSQTDEKYKREVLWRDWSWQKAVMKKQRHQKILDIDLTLLRNRELSDIKEEKDKVLKCITGSSQRKILEMIFEGYTDKEIVKAMNYQTINSYTAMISKIIATVKTKLYGLN